MRVRARTQTHTVLSEAVLYALTAFPFLYFFLCLCIITFLKFGDLLILFCNEEISQLHSVMLVPFGSILFLKTFPLESGFLALCVLLYGRHPGISLCPHPVEFPQLTCVGSAVP